MKRIYLMLLSLCVAASSFAYVHVQDTVANIGGKNRTMEVFYPTKTSTNMPLMIVTHGMNQDPKYQYDSDQMYKLVDTEKFVIAYLRSDGNTWDVWGTNDQTFVLKTIDRMYAKHKIDKNRVYWSGFSMGSMLIYHCMPNVQDKIAAFAPTSGVTKDNNKPWNLCKKPVNLIHCHSKYDGVFNYDEYQIHSWVENMAKMNKFTTYIKLENYAPASGITGDKEVWTNSSTGKVVELYSYNSGGHWPEADCGREIWNFCKRFSLKDASTSQTVTLKKGAMTQPTTFDPNFHIYLCFGQSNMEGNAAIQAQDCENVDPRFRMMAAVNMTNTGRVKGNWYVAYPPLCRGGNGLTPADYFGRTMVECLPDSISVGVINVAVGGASIKLFDEDLCASQISGAADWFKNYCKEYGNNPYQRLVECAKKAQKVGVIKGILLHQGCTDNTQKDWPVRVKRVYKRLLNDLGLEEDETPLIVGELLQKDMGGVCWGHNEVIAHITDAVPNAYIASSAQCPAASDGLHFTAEGYRLIGQRYAAEMLKALGKKAEIDYDTTANLIPLTKQAFNPSLYLQGTAKVAASTVMYTATVNDCFGGWRHSKGLDFSSYKYLIFELGGTSYKNRNIKIFDTDDYLNPCYTQNSGNSRKVVIDLRNMKNSEGGVVDPSHIYMLGTDNVVFTSSSQSYLIKAVYLSDDGQTPSSVESVLYDAEVEGTCFDLNGRKLVSPKGLYIKNGKKYLDK